MPFEYDVALSFAGEDRSYVEQVARALRRRGVRVFYDGFEEATLWGKDLYVHLREVYQHKARFTVLFASVHYARKAWPSHERASAQARALTEAREYILPARFDDTEIPGLLPTTAYIDLRSKPPEDLAELVAQKVTQGALATPPSDRARPYRARRPDERLDRLMVPFRPPTGVNIPAGYQRTLNARAAEVRSEFATRYGDGYAYPVELAGSEPDLRAFASDATTLHRAEGIEVEVNRGEGELWFEYRGGAAPDVMKELARAHHLRVVHCGATMLLDMKK